MPRIQDPIIREQNKLVEQHLNLAKSRATYFKSVSGLPFEDLYSEACLSLVKLVRRYDPTRGVTFGAYAKVGINGYLYNYIRDKSRSIKVPRQYISIFLKMNRLERELGKTLTINELVTLTGISEELILKTKEAMASSHSQINEQIIADSYESHTDSELLYEELNLDQEAMINAIASLSGSEEKLLVDAFVHGKTMNSLCRRYSLSEAEIRTAQTKLLERLIDNN